VCPGGTSGTQLTTATVRRRGRLVTRSRKVYVRSIMLALKIGVVCIAPDNAPDHALERYGANKLYPTHAPQLPGLAPLPSAALVTTVQSRAHTHPALIPARHSPSAEDNTTYDSPQANTQPHSTHHAHSTQHTAMLSAALSALHMPAGAALSGVAAAAMWLAFLSPVSPAQLSRESSIKNVPLCGYYMAEICGVFLC
jgi:hypothetical protein